MPLPTCSVSLQFQERLFSPLIPFGDDYEHRHCVPTQLICRTSGASDVAWDVHIIPVDLRGDASPLASTTLLCPRRSRAGNAKCPRYWQRSCPWQRTVRGRGLAAYRQCPRTVRGHDQSMSSDSPRTRTCHGQVADMDSPEARSVHGLGLAMSTNSPRPCSIHRIRVSAYKSGPRLPMDLDSPKTGFAMGGNCPQTVHRLGLSTIRRGSL